MSAAWVIFRSSRQKNTAVKKEEDIDAKQRAETSKQPEKMEALLKVDALALEVGYGLIGLVSSDDSFLNRIREIRRQSAIEMGIIVPSVHVTDNLQLPPLQNTQFCSAARKCAQGEIHPEGCLAIDPGVVKLEKRLSA